MYDPNQAGAAPAPADTNPEAKTEGSAPVDFERPAPEVEANAKIAADAAAHDVDPDTTIGGASFTDQSAARYPGDVGDDLTAKRGPWERTDDDIAEVKQAEPEVDESHPDFRPGGGQTVAEARDALARAGVDPNPVQAAQTEVASIPGVDPLGYGNATRLRTDAELAGNSTAVTDHGQPTATTGEQLDDDGERVVKVTNDDLVEPGEVAAVAEPTTESTTE